MPVLLVCNHQQMPFAYKLYASWAGNRAQRQFPSETFSMNVEIEFVGVWFVFVPSQYDFELMVQIRDTIDTQPVRD